MAWHGQPMLIEELLFKSPHGLVDQSLHSRLGAETTNGDGFGVGWYGVGTGPGLYRSIAPAWNDANLRHLAAHIRTPLYLAHVRATSGTTVQETNCHPFLQDGWLFVHNGLINEFHAVRRELLMALDARSVGAIEGSADSELIFHLALGFGLEGDPLGALETALGFVEQTLRSAGIEPAVQASIGVSDGNRLWAVRYSSVGDSRTLFRSEDVDALRTLHPDLPALEEFREGDHIVVSEPIADLPGAWHEIPEATGIAIAADGAWEARPFVPRAPAPA
jgi:glutamine amidotransferase